MGREMHRHPSVDPVASSEERQALGVVPMKVREEQRASERLAVQESRHMAEPGAAVEQEPRAVVDVGRKRDA